MLGVGAAEDGAGFFCRSYLVEEVADFGQFFCGDYYAFDFVEAFVMEDVVLHLDVAFVAGVVALGVHRLGKLVNHVAGGQRNVEHIGLQSGALEFDGIFARFSGEDAGTFIADDARAKNEQVAGGFGIALYDELIMQGKVLVVFIEIADARRW